MKIDITVEGILLPAQLTPSRTTDLIAAALPLEGGVHTWGEEIYFEIPIDAPLADDAVQEVEVGTIAYWPPGRALCIFFGPTPVSTGEKPQAYSPVNVIGQITGDTAILKKVPDGATIRIS